MDFGHWLYNKEFNCEEWFGFIYRITELDTLRQYLGKKQFYNSTRKVVKGRKNKKKVIKESNWREYTGSSKELNEQITLKGKENYKFEIISLHKTKGSLFYAEVKIQINEDVLRKKLVDNNVKMYYNKNINGVKFIPPDEDPDEINFNT